MCHAEAFKQRLLKAVSWKSTRAQRKFILLQRRMDGTLDPVARVTPSLGASFALGVVGEGRGCWCFRSTV